jgi:hypothetical protein
MLADCTVGAGAHCRILVLSLQEGSVQMLGSLTLAPLLMLLRSLSLPPLPSSPPD